MVYQEKSFTSFVIFAVLLLAVALGILASNALSPLIQTYADQLDTQTAMERQQMEYAKQEQQQRVAVQTEIDRQQVEYAKQEQQMRLDQARRASEAAAAREAQRAAAQIEWERMFWQAASIALMTLAFGVAVGIALFFLRLVVREWRTSPQQPTQPQQQRAHSNGHALRKAVILN